MVGSCLGILKVKVCCMYINEIIWYDCVCFMCMEKGRGKEEWIGWKIIEVEKFILWMVDDGDNVEWNV